jgi:hypothetical protein
MKTNIKISVLAVSALALSLSHTVAVGQPFNASSVVQNRAIAASPRAREVFPGLTRDGVTPVKRKTSPTANATLSEVNKSRAWATSPRGLEEFPELLRPAQPRQRSADVSVASTIIKNRALGFSPRGLEEFPWLSRGVNAREEAVKFELAPLK